MEKELKDKINTETNEISILDLLSIIIEKKHLIFCITITVAVLVFLFSLISLKLPADKTYLPNVYKPKAEMLINDSNGNNSNLTSALNSSGLGSLASMLNTSGGNTKNSALAQYLVTSPSIQDAVINKFFREEIEKKHTEKVEKLKEKGKYKPEEDNWVFPLMDARDKLLKIIETNYDSSTGVFTIAVENKDPQLACDIINFTVELLEKRFEDIGVDKNKNSIINLEKNINTAYQNIIDLQNKSKRLDNTINSGAAANYVVIDTNMLQVEIKVQEQIYSTLKTQYETTKVNMASEQPVFQILEYAQIPDRKSGPSRGKLCIIVTMAGFFLSIFLAFLLNAIENIKNDPEAMAKLHPNKKAAK